MIEKIIKNSSWRRLRFKVGNKTNIYMEAFKAICRLREKIAIQHNIIKNKIFPDPIIKVLLDKKPQTLDELQTLVAEGIEYFTNTFISAKRNDLTATEFRYGKAN